MTWTAHSLGRFLCLCTRGSDRASRRRSMGISWANRLKTCSTFFSSPGRAAGPPAAASVHNSPIPAVRRSGFTPSDMERRRLVAIHLPYFNADDSSALHRISDPHRDKTRATFFSTRVGLLVPQQPPKSTTGPSLSSSFGVHSVRHGAATTRRHPTHLQIRRLVGAPKASPRQIG